MIECSRLLLELFGYINFPFYALFLNSLLLKETVLDRNKKNLNNFWKVYVRFEIVQSNSVTI